jgi:hypothetical protein
MVIILTSAVQDIDAPIIPLVEGRLYALPNPYPLDGRICTHPLEARGWGNQNCYLAIEGKRAVLVDTGFSVHEKSMIARLEQLVRPDMTLEVSVLRLGEYYGACNVRPIVERFGIKKIYSARRDGVESTDFRPDHVPWGTPTGSGAFAEVQNVQVRGNGYIDLGSERHLSMLRPPLRLLSTNWLYDAGTKTMMTADQFTYSWQATPDGPWVVGENDEMPTEQHVHDFMVGTRYWWLPGAETSGMIADLEKLFAAHEVERIAPGFGLVLDGPDVVKKHVALFRSLLEKFPSEPATGVDAGYTKRSTKRAPMAGGAR